MSPFGAATGAGASIATPAKPDNMMFIIPEPWNSWVFRRYYLLDPATGKRLTGFKTIATAAAAAKMLDKTPIITECDLVRGGDTNVTINYYTRERYT